MTKHKPLVLCILDGVGLRDSDVSNAVAGARLPTLAKLSREYPGVAINASGLSVGLPVGTMGNSEVGHITIGSGRVVKQYLLRFQEMLRNKTLFSQPNLARFVSKMAKNRGIVHVMGLMSDGDVHADLHDAIQIVRHLLGKKLRVCIHFIADGRDVSPISAEKYILEIKSEFKSNIKNNSLFFGTISGRYWSMDRNNNWARTELSFNAVAYGKSKYNYPDIDTALKSARLRGETDEFVAPTCIADYSGISKNDGFLFTNYRSDRARQIVAAVGDPKFNKFNRGKYGVPTMLGFSQYDENSDKYCPALILDIKTENTLGLVLSKHGLKQLRIAETEKYNHVTYFFDAESMDKYHGEEQILIPSPSVATFDLAPEMSAKKITKILIDSLSGFDFVVVNYANGDMLGHTGIESAAIHGLETVDSCLSQLVPAVLKLDGTIIITADHGNAEEMWDKKHNMPHTAHTTNLVPFMLIGNDVKNYKLRNGGGLSDIAPTVLDLLGIKKPAQMTGVSLVKNKN